jgi:nickel-dependent lactate racemase
MTTEEIRAHFGEEVVRRVRVANNPWRDPAEMVELGVTENGTPVTISREAMQADFLIGVGSIVPHHIPGYSGGAKIVQPGLTGAATTGATHFLSTRAPHSYLGQVENPVRAKIERIAGQVGLKAIFNVILDPAGRLVQAFYGDFVQATAPAWLFRGRCTASRCLGSLISSSPGHIPAISSSGRRTSRCTRLNWQCERVARLSW